MQNAYRAHAQVENGKLTLENVPFAEGEAVEVIVLAEARDSKEPASHPAPAGKQAAGSALSVLESLVGSIEAPPDFADEHDHYLYGSPKRTDRGG